MSEKNKGWSRRDAVCVLSIFLTAEAIFNDYRLLIPNSLLSSVGMYASPARNLRRHHLLGGSGDDGGWYC